MTASTLLHPCRVLLAVLALLGACGGGVVGTGTGPGDGPDASIPFQSRPVCEASFAATTLACFVDGRDLYAGTAPVKWSDSSASADTARATALAELDGNTMALQAPCARLGFIGNWGRLTDGSSGFVGRTVAHSPEPSRQAIVRLQPAPDHPEAVGWLQVVDSEDQPLAGPWLLRRTGGVVDLAGCSAGG